MILAGLGLAMLLVLLAWTVLKAIGRAFKRKLERVLWEAGAQQRQFEAWERVQPWYIAKRAAQLRSGER